MKAAVMHQFGEPFVLEEIELDEPIEDELVIRTAASGICHSDISVFEGGFPYAQLPMVLGHEVAGIVEQVGPRVDNLRPGDHVVTSPSAFCGRCEWCMKGRPYRCTNKHQSRPEGMKSRLSLDGTPVAQWVGLGGFAEKMLVDKSAATRIPSELPLDRAALLGCGAVTGLGAVLNTTKPEPGSKIAVLGLGGVGLSAVQGAALSNPSCVVAIDRVESKLDLARTLGATHTVNASEEDVTASVMRITGDGVDHAFEAVGRSETIEQCFALLREGGTATVIGVPHTGDTITIQSQPLLGERKLQGSRMGSTRFPIDVALYASLYLDGRLRLDELLSRTIPLDDINTAIDEFGSGVYARTIITFPEA